MKLCIKFLLLFVLTNLLGCASFTGLLDSNKSNSFASYPSLQSFKIENAVIHYKDLSDPCDSETVAWQDLNEADRLQRAAIEISRNDCGEFIDETKRLANMQFEVQNKVSITFTARQTEIYESHNVDSLLALNELISKNTQFHIYGAAGTVGDKSKALGLSRAHVVREHLINVGVHSERITIMPYDPTIPGLQAVVEVLEPVI